MAPHPLWCRQLLRFAPKLGCTSVYAHFTSFSCIVSLLPTFPLPQTGPKGVLSDYRRFEQVQKQEADHEKQEQLAQMQREAVTCRSAVSERRLDSMHTVLCTMGLGWAEVWRDVGYKTLTLFCSWRRPSWLKHRTIVHYCYVCECSASQVCLPWHEPLQQEMATPVILVS